MKNFLEFLIEDADNLIKIIDLFMQLFSAFDNLCLIIFLMISQNGYLNFLIRKIISACKYICCYVASVVSDSVQPHRWKPTRLPHPWDSLGKNTGVGRHFLLQCVKVKSESEVAQSCLTLSNPMDCSPPGSSIHGIFQARVLEWSCILFVFL